MAQKTSIETGTPARKMLGGVYIVPLDENESPEEALADFCHIHGGLRVTAMFYHESQGSRVGGTKRYDYWSVVTEKREIK